MKFCDLCVTECVYIATGASIQMCYASIQTSKFLDFYSTINDTKLAPLEIAFFSRAYIIIFVSMKCGIGLKSLPRFQRVFKFQFDLYYNR